jgi:hypothetical protein
MIFQNSAMHYVGQQHRPRWLTHVPQRFTFQRFVFFPHCLFTFISATVSSNIINPLALINGDREYLF